MANPTSNEFYGLLTKITDPHQRMLLKLMIDKLHALDATSQSIGSVSKPFANDVNAASKKITALKDPTATQDAATKNYVDKTINTQLLLLKQQLATPTTAPPPPPINTAPSGTNTSALICHTSIAGGQPNGVPASPNPRWFRGDFIGVSVPGVAAVPGGSVDPTCIVSFLLDRYSAADQTTILNAHVNRGYTHFVLGWPDSRSGNGQSVSDFVTTATKVKNAGLFPVVFLFSNAYDPHNPDPTTVGPVLNALIAANVITAAIIGLSADEVFDPGATIQAAIDFVTGICVPAGVNCYVHFNPGVTSWQQNGQGGSVFWNANKGKLTGICHQSDPAWDCGLWQSKLNDLQVRFGHGASGWPTDSGFGHPFDTVAFEYSASRRFSASIDEATARQMGQQAISTPDAQNPAYAISGFCNGGPRV